MGFMKIPPPLTPSLKGGGNFMQGLAAPAPAACGVLFSIYEGYRVTPAVQAMSST